MNIENMNDSEKSVILAKLCGWEMRQHSVYKSEYSLYMHDYGSHGYYMTDDVPNLYDPANMALAWRVLNWATHISEEENIYGIGHDVHFWWMDAELNILPPEDAQREWLDKILSLAIEAGMVEESE